MKRYKLLLNKEKQSIQAKPSLTGAWVKYKDVSQEIARLNFIIQELKKEDSELGFLKGLFK
jgi:hypothetical protein